MSERRLLGDQFLEKFKAQRAAIEEGLTGTKSGSATPKDLEPLQSQVTALRSELTENLELLAAYDQRQLDLQLKALEQQLREVKAGSKPTGKFSFKRSKPPSKAAPAGETTPVGSSSSTPVSAPITSSSLAAKIPSTGHSLSSLSNTCITTTSLPSHPAGLQLTSLSHCLVNLIPSSSSPQEATQYSSIHARSLTNTVLLLPDIPGSVFLEECNGCLVVLGCHQFRMHASHNTTVLLSVKSVPIIEHCQSILVGGYPAALLPAAGPADGSTIDSKHLQMQDFNWLLLGPSPNWTQISAESLKAIELRLPTLLQHPPGPVEAGALGL